MLKTLRDAFKVKDIRERMLFTFLMLLVVRFGSQLPVPGVDRNYLANWFANQTGDAFNFFSAFTGGSFEKMSIFALNITPYITSSIIMQLLTIAIPALEEMHKDGEEGRKKIPLCDSRSGIDRISGNDHWFRKTGVDPGYELPDRAYCNCCYDSRFHIPDVDW